MTSKFLYFKKRTTFDLLVNTFPEDLSPICFIEDSNEIWFNYHFFLAGHESLRVDEIDNNVIVSLSDSLFKIIPGSNSILVRAQDNNIIISSNALTKIDTDDILEWKDSKLYHKESGIEIGTYGPQGNLSGVNIIKIPKITFNALGHAVSAETLDTTIRDYVELRSLDSQDSDRQVLLAERATSESDTNVTRKGKGLSYNNYSLALKTGSLEISGSQEKSLTVKRGDLVVEDGFIIGKLQGEVTGTATPKIHLSENPEYGGASKNLYGHVKLVDEITGVPAPSSDNSDTNKSDTVALAASPYLVYSYVQANKFKVNGIDPGKLPVLIMDNLDLTSDFTLSGNKVSISWTEV